MTPAPADPDVRDPRAYPKLRLVDCFPIRVEGNTLIELRDPANFTEDRLLLPPPVFYILQHFDGETGLVDIQASFARQFGEILPKDQLLEIIRKLDESGFLEGESFERRRREALEAFRDSPVRQARHAGSCYSDVPEELKEELGAFFRPPKGPGRPDPAAGGDPPRGIVAPHIDPRRGGVLYARAHKVIAERGRPVRTFLILGTGHHAPSQLLIPTRKAYATPLGDAPADAGAVEALAEGLGDGAFEEEWVHKTEHSIEFQALFLRYVLGPDHPFRIVPILCGSLHEYVLEGKSPREDERVERLVAALRRAVERAEPPLCVVASVDLAHVGRKFGDPAKPTPGLLKALEAKDRATLAVMAAGDPEGFFWDVEVEKDRRNICGLTPLYFFLRLLEGTKGEILGYDQAVEKDTDSVVSFAAMRF